MLLIISGQELLNKTWIKVKVERKDGSKIIDDLGTEDSELRYFFKNKDTVIILTSIDYNFGFLKRYSIIDDVLNIGDSQKFKLEFLEDSSLILLQIPNEPLNDDKINRYFFISDNKYDKFLIKNNLITFLNDSTISSNKYIWPHFKGNIDAYFTDKLCIENFKTFVIGSFTITSNGLITDINLKENKDLSKKVTDKFIDILKNTNGYWNINTNCCWDLPKINKSYYYKIYFTAILIHSGYTKMVHFKFNSVIPPCIENCNLSLDQKHDAINHFNKGNKFLNNDNLDKAIAQFTDCIKIDSVYFDAYYNRAASFYKLKNIDAACKDWEKLYQFGQKEGESLYFQNCKNK